MKQHFIKAWRKLIYQQDGVLKRLQTGRTGKDILGNGVHEILILTCITSASSQGSDEPPCSLARFRYSHEKY